MTMTAINSPANGATEQQQPVSDKPKFVGRCGFDFLGRFLLSGSLQFLANLRLLGNFFGGFRFRHQLLNRRRETG
jgi:hypothetical protein